MKSRFLSVFLAFVLTLGLCPEALAEEVVPEKSDGTLSVPADSTQPPVQEKPLSPDNADAVDQDGETSEGTLANGDSDDSESMQTEDANGLQNVIGSSMSTTAGQEAASMQNAERTDIDVLAADNAAALPDGVYLVKTGLANRQVLDVKAASCSNYANIQIYESNMTNAQKWRVVHDEQGYVTFINEGSGKALDVAAGSAKARTNVHQYEKNDTYAQKWIVIKSDDDSFTVVSALKKELVLDVAGARSANGTNVQIFDANSSRAQSFDFLPNSPAVAKCDKVVEDGYYEIASSVNGSYVLDVANASLNDRANIRLYSANKSPAQLFRFVYVDGFYRIETAASNKCLDVAGANLVSGTNVQQYTYNGTDSQKWSIRANSNGTYTAISKANGLALDIAAGSMTNGANVQVFESNATNAQQFNLVKRTNLLGEGLCTIRSMLKPVMALDVVAASTAEGANVQLYESNASHAQLWEVSLVDGEANTYTVQSVVSGKYLAADGGGNVCQRSLSGDNTQWWMPSIANGAIVLTNVASGLVLDVSRASTANGANIQTYAANGSNAQQFAFSGAAPLASGAYYMIRSCQDPSQVIDTAAASLANGANVQTYTSNNTGAQKWKIVGNNDGTYTFLNANSGKALDVKSAQAITGANVQQYSSNNTLAQKWRVVYQHDGRFKVVSALNDALVLSVAGGVAQNYANVNISTDEGLASQRFTFAKTTYDPLPADQRAMLNKANELSSRTSWLILVNCSTHKVGIFNGGRGNWSYSKYWPCTTGAVSTPTVKGVFTVGSRGLSFGSGYTCWYWTQFFGNYLFHSVLYQPGSMNNIQDGRLGISASHGCVRLNIDNARWIYDVIPSGTTVLVY
ncbi:RICIN domain-containing protein [Enteroscipio rubneri]|nr:RICIN domain-containing protein [Enteroscipio rubneri]